MVGCGLGWAVAILPLGAPHFYHCPNGLNRHRFYVSFMFGMGKKQKQPAQWFIKSQCAQTLFLIQTLQPF